jgi:hypothetical protein
MWALSSTIRENSYWWEKVDDDMIMEKWKQEALEQQKGLPKARALTERMLLRIFSLTQGSGRDMMGSRYRALIQVAIAMSDDNHDS